MFPTRLRRTLTMTSFTILQTKIFIPPFRDDYISRPRLLEKISHGMQRKLVGLIAPAGYGKSTLMAEWCRQTRLPTAWLSLDRGHNDPITFCQYLIICLQTILPDIGESILYTLNSPNPPLPLAMLTSLVNEIIIQKQDIALILDDFHNINHPDVIQILQALIANQPPQFHLLIASRSDLPFSNSKLRAQGELLTLGVDDLRFSPEEISTYLQSHLGDRITSFEERVIGDRSEGWITGLHLAVLSFQNDPNIHAGIENFSGEDRFITDYLMDEVLSRQRPEVYEFLLKTCLLDKMSAPLCDHLTGYQNSQDILEELDRSGLFTIPLDNTRNWYRYHHLFAELLLHRLKHNQPDQIANIHRQAAGWFFEHNMLEEAVEHFLSAGEYTTVIDYLVGISDDMLAKGKFTLYLDWLDRIPEDLLKKYPKLVLTQVFQLWEMGSLDKYRRQLKFAEDILGSFPNDPSKLSTGEASYHGILAVIKGVYYCGGYDIKRAFPSFERALSLLPEDLTFWRGLSLGATGFCYRVQGDYGEAIRYFRQAENLSTQSGLTLIYFMYSIARVLVLYASGKLNEAIENCHSPLSMDERQRFKIPFSGLAYTVMGELLYQSSQINQAENHLKRGIDLVIRDGDVYFTARAYFNLAKVYIANGNDIAALNTMDVMMNHLHQMKAPHAALVIARSFQANIWIWCGQPGLARSWANNTEADQLAPEQYPEILGQSYFGVYCTIHEPFRYYLDIIQLTRARYEIHYGSLPEAIAITEEMIKITSSPRRFINLMQALLLNALARFKSGEKARSIQLVLQAIRQIQPEPYLQLFISEGKLMQELLALVADYLSQPDCSDPDRKYILSFLEQVHTPVPADYLPERDVQAASLLDLTPREVEVLKLLAGGISYKDTAKQLVISQNTVKTHLKRIYSKLDVANRLQAVNKAKEIGLIPNK